MAKKVVATLKSGKGKEFSKVIKMIKSPKTVSYSFKEEVVHNDVLILGPSNLPATMAHDASTLYARNVLALIEKGEIPATMRETLEPSYVAGLFRSARFGVHEAHGRGVIAQFNYLLAKGALEVDAAGRFRAVSDKFANGIRDLLQDMLILQATGDYDGTAAFLETHGRPSQPLLDAIDRLDDVPVDIRPIYTQADELLGN